MNIFKKNENLKYQRERWIRWASYSPT